MRTMGLQAAGESVWALFGRPAGGRPAALLLGAVLLAHRPELHEIVIDDEAEDG